MKVVIAGASGSGKTTLAKALAANFGWGFIENSAGKIIGTPDKLELSNKYSYEGNWGQRKVINQSHIMPQFGRDFQEAVLQARMYLREQPGNYIYDRSSLDPIVFYLNQVVHNDTQYISEMFIKECVRGLRGIDLILRLPLQNPDEKIEDNNSRVANWFFQKKIDDLFDTALEMVLKYREELQGKEIHVDRCPAWDWETRLSWARYCINHFVLDKG